MPVNENVLAARWRDSWQRFGIASPDVEATGKALFAAYGEPSRHYHNMQHLEDVMWFVDWAKAAMMTTHELMLLQPDERWKLFGEVELALWYHDAVYDAKKKDNEEKSRDWFLRDAKKFGLPEDSQQTVAHLIDLTAHHKDATTLQECIMADCDLSILGAERGKFIEYDKNIRREYAHVLAPAYRIGRRKVLQGFLAQPKIFKTRAFAQYYEQAARENLKSALVPSFFEKLLGVFRK